MDEQAAHPRVRIVTRTDSRERGVVELQLECGHSTRRRPHICVPRRVICAECPY